MGILINFVLDETGSMSVAKKETIAGFNEYIDGLKAQGDSVSFTLTKFNSEHIGTPYLDKPIAEVKHLTEETYVPHSTTPLYDAIGRTIHEVAKKLTRGKKPSVLFVVMTDGLENASTEYTRDGIFKLIEEKTAQGWTFAYLGANQDSWAISSGLGIPVGNAINYDARMPHIAMRQMKVTTDCFIERGGQQTEKFFGGREHVPSSQDSGSATIGTKIEKPELGKSAFPKSLKNVIFRKKW